MMGEPLTERARFVKKLAEDNNRRILLNARRVSAQRYRRLPNWKVAADLFGFGSTFAAMLCLEYGFDPDGYKFLPAPPPAGTDDKEG